MDAAPLIHDRTTEDRLAEAAMRQTATILGKLTACRRRACRRNGCCGVLVENDGGAVPRDGHAGFAVIPPCILGIDEELAGVFAEQTRILLGLLRKNPDYKLHPARLA